MTATNPDAQLDVLARTLAQQNRLLRGWAAVAAREDARRRLGVQMGAPSGGLTDADLDCPEAVLLGGKMLPETRCEFGRRSKRRSHCLYRL